MGSHARIVCIEGRRNLIWLAFPLVPKLRLGNVFREALLRWVRGWPSPPPFISERCPACTAGLHLDRRPPPPNAASKMVKMCIFLEEFDPFRQLCWRAEGGSGGEKKLDSRVLLALRQCPPLAGRAPQRATSRSQSPGFRPLSASPLRRKGGVSRKRSGTNIHNFKCCQSL